MKKKRFEWLHGRRIVLVDTPGLDADPMSEAEIIQDVVKTLSVMSVFFVAFLCTSLTAPQ